MLIGVVQRTLEHWSVDSPLQYGAFVRYSCSKEEGVEQDQGRIFEDRLQGTAERRRAHGARAVTETCPGHNCGNDDNHQQKSSDKSSARFHNRRLTGVAA